MVIRVQWISQVVWVERIIRNRCVHQVVLISFQWVNDVMVIRVQ